MPVDTFSLTATSAATASLPPFSLITRSSEITNTLFVAYFDDLHDPICCTESQAHHSSLQIIPENKRQFTGCKPSATSSPSTAHMLHIVSLGRTAQNSLLGQTLYSVNYFFCHYWIKQTLLISEMEKSNQILWGLYWLIQYFENYYFLLLWCWFSSISCNLNYKIGKSDVYSHKPNPLLFHTFRMRLHETWE